MKSKKFLLKMLISILFIATLGLSIRKVREEKKIEVSNVETESNTAIDATSEELEDNETADLDELEEDMVQEFPIEHTVKLSSELSPDSPFQKLLATGNVEITNIFEGGWKYVTLNSVYSIIPEFKSETYNEMKEKFDSLILSEV